MLARIVNLALATICRGSGVLLPTVRIASDRRARASIDACRSLPRRPPDEYSNPSTYSHGESSRPATGKPRAGRNTQRSAGKRHGWRVSMCRSHHADSNLPGHRDLNGRNHRGQRLRKSDRRPGKTRKGSIASPISDPTDSSGNGCHVAPGYKPVTERSRARLIYPVRLSINAPLPE